MLKKMKHRPLLFIEILFWKTRRECHYINAEYLLHELGHLKKGNRNQDSVPGNTEVESSEVANEWVRRSIADALGEDEADVVIAHDIRHQNGENSLENESEMIYERREGLFSMMIWRQNSRISMRSSKIIQTVAVLLRIP
ncbi:hypothetical protein V6Z12_A12G288500 [Gossypium hirsutum]